MKRALMTTALVGTAFGGYYFANTTEYQELRRIVPSSIDLQMEDLREPRAPIAAYEYYQQPEFDVTFDGEVIYVWED